MTPQERDREIRLAQAVQRRECDRFLREKPGQRAGLSVPCKKSEKERKESGGQQVAVF